MADVPGKFYRATKVRTGVSPSSAGSIEGEPLPPVNPPGSSLNSVGLTMPSAFTVSNSPLTANGTIGVAGAGTVSQYIRGDGSLADFPESSGGGGSVSYYLNGSVNQGTIGGVAYKELNKVPILGAGTQFSISADGYIASFLTDAGDPNLLEIPGGNWNFETYFSSSSSGGTPTFYVELYKYDGTTFTLIASSVTSPEFIAFGTTLTPYFSTLAVPTTTLALTDRLAVRYYVTHSGRTITLHTENNTLCQIITTFTTGLTALNGLTAQVQNFAVGTTGTDFNIASATATHTFNLPTASATNRGALSSADWSMFNAKENAITAGTTAQYFRGDKTFQTLNTSVVPELTNLYYTEARVNANANVAANTAARHNAVTLGTANGLSLSTQVLSLGLASAGVTGALSGTDWSTFNGKQNALTNPVTGTGTTNYLPKFTGTTTIGNSNLINDSSGNLGLGVTPSAWSGPALQIGNLGLATRSGLPTLMQLSANQYWDGSNHRRIVDGVATIYTQNNGSHNWDTVAFGTAGSVISWSNAMILTASGRLLINTPTESTFQLDVTGTGRFTSDLTANRYRGVNSLVLNSYTTVNPSSNVYLYSPPNDRDAWIYLDSADTGSNWGIYHRQIDTTVSGLPANSIGFIGGGSSTLQAWISLANGNGFFAGSLTAANLSGTNTGDVTIGTANGLSLSGQALSLGLASSSTNGALSSTDWTTFNSKQNAGNYVTTDTTQTITASKTFSLDIIVNGVNVGRGGGSIFTNTRIGNLSFVNNTTGANNTSVGYGSLGSNTTGNSNSAFGKDSLGLNTSGINNSALGLNALVSNTTGGNNIGIGLSSLGNNTTGSENIGIGSYAGSITNGAIANNTSSNSIYIGYYTRASANGNTNEIVIGYDARGQGSNTAIIGNSSITKTILNGNVGIGTSSPTIFSGNTTLAINNAAGGAVLELQSNGTSAFRMATSASDSALWEPRSVPVLFATANTPRMTITSGGNVLIASNSDNGQAIVQIGGSNNTKLSLKDGTSQNGMRWESVGGANAFYLFNGTFGTAGWGLYNITTAGTPLWVTNGGNVGIGNTGASNLLTVGADATAHYTQTGIAIMTLKGISSGARGLFEIHSSDSAVKAVFQSVNGYGVNLGCLTSSDLILNNPSGNITLKAGGNVLIGTTTDVNAKLYVNGDIRTGALGGGYVSGYWKMGRAILGTQPTETYQIIVEINGALYAIGAANL